MEPFLREIVDGQKFELVIDTQIFSKDIVLKASYNFLDRGYFFFKFDEKQNIILQFTAKEDIKIDPKKIIGEFSDELLDVYLRDKLEKDNKVIREIIVEKAINGPIDANNFVSLDTDKQEKNQIDFDADLDDILKEIEGDPDLQVDEDEIAKILKEIESDSQNEVLEKPQLQIDPDSINTAKDMFKNKK